MDHKQYKLIVINGLYIIEYISEDYIEVTMILSSLILPYCWVRVAVSDISFRYIYRFAV
ncbi:unnamed protein product [Paramecium octaurelia]|uniref:Uncharacterized protein n=1 Tax=Paramecium octaurelia TaxID=43137 RepID=A0A8S1WST5_PAROT|nr:unnamed protein product [Paramecium octaurelia]